MPTKIVPLACPFCGHTGVSTFEGSTFRWMYASCDECGAQTGEVRKDTLSKDRDEAQRNAEQDAIAEWNRRAAAPEPVAEVVASSLDIALIQQVWPKVYKFFTKHAIGQKSCPSCLMCGNVTPNPADWAIRHMELPSIYICKTCAESHAAPQSQRAVAEPVAQQEISEPRFFIDHGMIHDRITGRHVHGDREIEPGIADEAVFTLNELHASALREIKRATVDAPPNVSDSPLTPFADSIRQMNGTLSVADVNTVAYGVAALERKLAEAQRELAEVKQRVVCDVCLGEPLPSGKECICCGHGTIFSTLTGMRQLQYDTNKRAELAEQRLREVSKPDDALVARLIEPRAGIHEDGTEELKSWETLYEQCREAAAAIGGRG